MYCRLFEEFYIRSEELFLSNPLRTRFTVKYRNREKKFILKVTDDRQCFKFISKQQQDVKKLEKIAMLFIRGSGSS